MSTFRRFAAILCALLILCAVSFAEYEGAGFDTPEEAVAYYVDGLRNLDFEQMLGAFAWETQAAHYDVELELARVRAYIPTNRPRIPGDGDFLTQITLHTLRAKQTDTLIFSLESFLLGDQAPMGKAINLRTDEEMAAFLEKFDIQKLESLRTLGEVRFLSPDAVTGGRFSDERAQKNFRALTAPYGADEVREIVAAAGLGDAYLFCAPVVARYGGKWYLVSVSGLTANLLNTSPFQQAFIVMTDIPEGLLD